MRFVNPWKSIRLKMSLLAAVILGGILILYSFYLFVQLQNVLSRNLDAELKVKALELAKTIKAFQETKSPGGDIHYAAIKVLNFDLRFDRSQDLSFADRQWLRLIDRYDLDYDHVAVVALDGNLLASSDGTPPAMRQKLREMFTLSPHIRPVWGTLSHHGQDLRVVQMTILARDKPHYYIQIATPLITVNQFLEGRLWGIAVSVVVVVVLFSLVGLLLANQILHPVYKIVETAEGTTHEDLSKRVEIAEVDNEMRVLVNAFNKMIERLETSFKHMAGMVEHMAHELKTPLAIIKGEGQMALRRDRSSAEYRQVIESNVLETEKMFQVIDDLLTAANIAYDKDIFRLEPIVLSDFLRDIYQKSLIISEVKNIGVELRLSDESVVIRGDRIHLRRLFFNLIDNAIKYSPPGSRVRIFTARERDGVRISIQDEGEGIAAEDVPRIFGRTFKKKVDNNALGNSSDSSGFGLYLCRVIAEAHLGEIQVDSTLGTGSTFSLFLPLQ